MQTRVVRLIKTVQKEVQAEQMFQASGQYYTRLWEYCALILTNSEAQEDWDYLTER